LEAEVEADMKANDKLIDPKLFKEYRKQKGLSSAGFKQLFKAKKVSTSKTPKSKSYALTAKAADVLKQLKDDDDALSPIKERPCIQGIGKTIPSIPQRIGGSPNSRH